MELTGAEKIVIGVNIFLFLVLLTLIGLQLTIDKLGINMRQFLAPSPAITSAPTKLLDNTNITIEVPEPTAEEEIGAKQPRRAWVGWTIIVISGLFTLGGLTVRFIKH